MHWGKENDTQVLVDALKLNGYAVSEDDAQALWYEYSDTMDVTWLYVGDDAERLAKYIRDVLNESKQMELIRQKYELQD